MIDLVSRAPFVFVAWCTSYCTVTKSVDMPGKSLVYSEACYTPCGVADRGTGAHAVIDVHAHVVPGPSNMEYVSGNLGCPKGSTLKCMYLGLHAFHDIMLLWMNEVAVLQAAKGMTSLLAVNWDMLPPGMFSLVFLSTC